MDLFDHARERTLSAKAPLAARMRPRTLDEFVGQRQILGPGRLLRRAIQADQLSSLIFFGPPGTGKTTLARIIANTTRAHFTALNAVLAGVADLRQAIAEATERLGQHGKRTILFVDEVHRFNKAQQDALLPHVENGTVVLIGATTENPYFEVNKALVSRSRIFELRPLAEEDLRALLSRALTDAKRGYGTLKARVEPEALAHLARVANGDARSALNALELALETTEPGPDGVVAVTLAVAEESIQRKAVLYDKEGDAHFDTISAFIKSLRGSDPDAALYWMARMIYAGEEPRFVFRRMIVFAAEDVGLADPEALRVVTSAAQAFEYVGMPEGRFHLAEACLYLATAPKSNSAFAFFDALAAVEQERTGDVPDPLKDANRDREGLGHGEGYLYPHAYRDHWVAQQYLPDSLRGRIFYEPSTVGREAGVRDGVVRLREAQLEALREAERLGRTLSELGGAATEGGAAPLNAAAEWALRSEGALTRHLEGLREAMFALARLERQHLVLDANAGGGLLVWEALRRCPQGGVWARVEREDEARALKQEAGRLSELGTPVVLWCSLDELAQRVTEVAAGGTQSAESTAGKSGPGDGSPAQGTQPAGRMGATGETAAGESVRFDRILARGILGGAAESGTEDRVRRLGVLAELLAPGGSLVLAETVPLESGRFFAALARQAESRGALPKELAERLVAAEERLHADAPLAWSQRDLEGWGRAAGLDVRERRNLASPVEVTLTPELIQRWFGPGSSAESLVETRNGLHGRSRLAQHLGEAAADIRARLLASMAGQKVQRHTTMSVLRWERAGAGADPARANHRHTDRERTSRVRTRRAGKASHG